MTPLLYALALLLLSINVVLGLPKITDFTQQKLAVLGSAGNLGQTAVLAGEVAGTQKVDRFPKSLGLTPPSVSAASALVIDPGTGFVFFGKDPDKRVPIASTTKIMTALVAVENFQQSDILTVPELFSISGSIMGLKAGEKLTLRSLLYGMLLNSGNDAAFTIAANFPGGAPAFMEAMNRKVADLGLKNTHFDNPIGFDSPNHFSSAADLAKIAALLPEDVRLGRIVATRQAEVTSIDKSVVHDLKNLNKLLDEPGVLGIKTGTTPLAKENFVGLIERDGRQLLTVVLGSNDRFGETRELIEWVYANFQWE